MSSHDIMLLVVIFYILGAGYWIMFVRRDHSEPTCPNCGRDRSEGEPTQGEQDD